MTFRKAVFIVCLLLVSESLFAQVTDTMHRADTLKPSRPVPEAIDTPVITKTVKDTVVPAIITEHKGYIINGKVEDANTGEGIPFAPISFANTMSGTAADLNGNFVI